MEAMRRLVNEDSQDAIDRLQRLAEEFQSRGMDLANGLSSRMPVDVREEEDELVISADLPGIEKEDISVRSSGNSVEITAESEAELREENEKYLRRERSSRRYSRSINWPKSVVEDSVEASYDDGVLEVRARKESEEEIEIN